MTWFKVDDQFWAHPKVILLSDSAIALWVKAGTWSAQHLTDGHVPVGALRLLQAQRRHADELVQAGLWLCHHDDGWLFHQWSEWQPTRAEVLERRERWKKKKAVSRGVSPGDTPWDSPGESTGESP